MIIMLLKINAQREEVGMQDSERKLYYEIVVDTWKTFYDDYGIEFTDEWWYKITSQFDMIREKYKHDDTAYLLAGKLAQSFLDIHERRQKKLYGETL